MKLIKFLAFAFLLACPMVAQAGVLSGLGGQLKLEDDDWESQVTGFADGTLDVGDLLFTVLEIQKAVEVVGAANAAGDLSIGEGATLKTFAPGTRSITGVSLIKVKSVTINSGGFGALYEFEGGSILDWSTTLIAAGTPLGLTVAADNTGAILFDDPIDLGGHIDFASLVTGLASAIEGDEIAQFTVDAWQAQVLDVGGTPTVVSAIDSLDFVGALSTTDSKFKKVDVLRDPDFGLSGPNQAFFAAVGAHDLELQGGLGTGAKGTFALRTDTDLYVNITVPEPSSIAIWSLAAVGALVVRRRKIKS